MGDARSEPYNSVYVLDPHFQTQDLVNVFHSPAGRAIMVQQEAQPRPLNLPNRNAAKFILESEDSVNGNLVQDFNTNNEDFEARLTRRLNRHRNEEKSASFDEQDLKKASLLDQDPEDFLDSKIFRYSSEKEILKKHGDIRFTDEKCDILRRMLSGFLSGWALGGNSHIRRRKRKSSDQLYMEASMALGIPCEMTDSCRCIECQCHYFDCGDSDSESSEVRVELNEGIDWESTMSDMEIQEPTPPSPPHIVHLPDTVISFEDETTTKVLASPVEAAVAPQEEAGEENKDSPPKEGGEGNNPVILEMAPSLEIAAGTPVILDHLLNNPMSCTIQ